MILLTGHISSFFASARRSLLTLTVTSLLGFLLLFCASCRRVNNVVWSKYAALPEEGWDPVNVIPFFPWPEDSINNRSDTYSLLLSIRFPALRDSSHIHLALHQEDDTGFISSDTISLVLAPPSNTPVGRGSYGIFETVDTVCRGIRLMPGYTVELQSLSDPENTRKILDIGLILMQENVSEESFFQQIKNISNKLQL